MFKEESFFPNDLFIQFPLQPLSIPITTTFLIVNDVY